MKVMSPVEVEFDPYLKWLGISETARPLDAYQFLGVPQLESDWVKLRRATEKQRQALDAVKLDADVELWNKIKRELEEAIALLNDPELKAVLDATLRRRLARTNPATVNVGPPAEIPPGLTIVCLGCSKENPGQRRFCAQCGSSLWDRCAKCNVEIAVDEKFCGRCGADVRGVLDGQRAAIEEKLATARTLAGDMQFEQAILLLRQVACIEDPKLDPWAQQALDLIDQLERNQQQTVLDAEQSFQKARQFVQQYAFENAIVLLDEIPQKMRTSEMEELRKKAFAARNEILSLGGEIRSAVESKRTLGLLPKIERLLVLKPNYSQAHKLAEQIRDKLVRKAQQELVQNQFQMALDSLRQLPPFIRNEAIEALTDKAEELHTLLQDIQRAPLATETVLAIANRLHKLSPKSESAQQLVADLEKKATQKPKNPRLAAVDFAPLPQRTKLDVPIDWLGYSTRLKVDDSKFQAILSQSPGEFFVALGLALQGLNRAKVQVDLLAKQKSGMMGMLSALQFKKKIKSAWGIDCSASGIKAIRLTVDDQGEIKLAAVESIAHQKLLTHPDAEVERSEIMAATFKQFLSNHKLEGDRIVAALPGQRVLGRFFELPPMAAKKVADTVQFEAKHQVPIPLEDLHWNYCIHDEHPVKEADDHMRRVLLLAAREFHVKDRVKQLKDAGVNVDVLTSDAVALHNALVYEFFEDENFKPSREGAIMTVDVGTDNTNIVVSSPNYCWFRPIGLSGNEFTLALVKRFKLTYEQAEQLKLAPHKARRLSPFYETLRPLYVQMTSELERSISSFQKLSHVEPITQVYGIGGGFKTHGLLRQLRAWD